MLAGFLDPRTLAVARRKAAQWGVSVFDVLLTGSERGTAAYVQQLARHLGVSCGPPDALPPDSLPAERVAAALRTELFRHPVTEEFVIVPRAGNMSMLFRTLHMRPGTRPRIRLAAPGTLAPSLIAASRAPVAEMMASGPCGIDYRLSAERLGVLRLAGIALIALIIGSAAATATGASYAHVPFALAFLALTILRLWVLTAFQMPDAKPLTLPDAALPLYTVLVPLHREARAVRDLIPALTALDYPAAKLDIKLLIEEDDTETLAALNRMDLPGHMERVVLPPGTPRTKPRALNLGLATARGALLAIFDAEDRPEPDQLKIAATAFSRDGEETLACVQARLSIDNTRDNWITKAFTLEYAGLFEVFLPTLARKGRLIPLGGTSNHFRTEVLRRVGGWDAYNVTEDADLGVRLTRFGYRIATIPSTTFEEAPNTLAAWIRQRTRWLKGYMVTWCVHMRQPRELLRELGGWNFLIFQAVICGVPLAALAQTVCLFLLAWQLASGTLMSGESPAAITIAALQALNLVLGYGAAAAIAWVGLERQNLKPLTRSLWLLVPYWLLIAVAGYRALLQLAVEPFRWEKTHHGLARTSRQGGLRDSAAGPGPRPPAACPD